MQKNRTNKLIGNTAVIAAGQFGSKILVYLLTRLYTSLLTSAEYSVANNISDIAVLLIPLISLGFGEAIFRLAKGDEYPRREVLTDSLVIVGCGCLLFTLILPILSTIDYFKDYIALIAFYVVASIIHTICSNYIRAMGYVRLYAVQGLLNTALVILLNIVFLIFLKMSAVGYVLSVPLADIAVSVFIAAKTKLHRELDFHGVKFSAIKSMLKYSLPLIPTTVFMWIVNISDRFMVTYFCGDAVNGLYTAAYKIPTLLGVMNSIFIYAWQISAMDERGKADRKKFCTLVFDSYSSFMFIAAGCIITCSKLITTLMFAKSYRDAWIYIPILTFAMVMHNLSSFLDSENMVRLRSMPTMLTALAGAATNVVLNFLFIGGFKMGGIGAAIATYISYTVTFALRAKIVGSTIAVQKYRLAANSLLSVALVLVTNLLPTAPAVLADLALLVILAALNFKPVMRTVKQSGILDKLLK